MPIYGHKNVETIDPEHVLFPDNLDGTTVRIRPRETQNHTTLHGHGGYELGKSSLHDLLDKAYDPVGETVMRL